MPDTVISIENLSKSYQLGVISTGTFYGDLKRWWARQRGFEDPYLKIGETDYGNNDGQRIWALTDLNFSVKQGEAIGIVGRNGAGKSTLLKILSRVTAPTSGIVKIKGRIASLLEVGTGFHPELTGRENIYLNGAIMGMSQAEVKRKFDEIVDFSGVEKFVDTPVKRYSSGMYVRLAFAVSAHLEPEILIVDEVLAVGDAEFQRKCLGKMGDVADSGRTVLFVSHNMAAVQRLCSRSIWLQKGTLHEVGETAKILDDYLGEMSNRDGESIADIPRTPGFGEKVRIVDCYTINSDNKINLPIKFGDPICLHIDLRAKQKMRNVSLTVGVDSSMDNRIATLISEESNAIYDMEPDQLVGVELTTKNLRLKPGVYYLTLALGQNKRPLDQVVKAYRFEVSQISSGNRNQDSHVRGDIYVDADWRIK